MDSARPLHQASRWSPSPRNRGEELPRPSPSSSPPARPRPPRPPTTSSSAAARSTTAAAARPIRGDVGLRGDRIAYVGPRLDGARPRPRSTPRGLAVAPGFINMLSWANEALIADPKGQSDIRQGVTLEVMGEGESMGPWSDADEAARDPAAGRHTLSDRVDQPRRLSRPPGAEGRLAQRRQLRRRDHGSGPRARRGRRRSDAGPARPDAGAGPRGDERGRDGGRLLAHLRPGLFRRDARADRAGDRGGQMRRPVYQPHARRRAQAARGDRRAGRDLGGFGRAGRNLPFQAVGPSELGQDRRGDRPGRGGAGARPEDHRRHVHLRRQLDRARRGDAALGAGGRHRGLGRPAEGPGAARPGARPRCARGEVSENSDLVVQRAVEGAPARLQDRGAQAAHRQDAGGGGAGARQDARRRPPPTSSSRTTAGSRSPISR